jgi:hypothetical protein
MFLAAAIHLVWSIEGFSDAAWLRDVNTGLFGDQILILAIVDLILAVVAFFAGYSLWKGGRFGWWVGLIAAIVFGARWIVYIPWYPIAALIVISIGILIVYGLAKHEDWFSTRRSS